MAMGIMVTVITATSPKLKFVHWKWSGIKTKYSSTMETR